MLVYLLLAIISSAMIAVSMRLSAHKVTANISMLAVNYLTRLLLAAGYAGFRVFSFTQIGFPATVAIGAINGVLYLLGFMLLQYNTRKNSVVLSSVFIKLGLLVPIILSVVLFKEMPTGLQSIGFVLTVGASVLINYEKGASHTGSKLTLILMLLASGSGDAMSKVSEVYGPRHWETSFYSIRLSVRACCAYCWFCIKRVV